MHRAVLLVATAVVLAGCVDVPGGGADGPEAPGTEGGGRAPEDPITVMPLGHVHDYWDGKIAKVLLDGVIPLTILHVHLLDEPPREQHMHGCEEDLVSESQGGSVKFSLPVGSIVPPGAMALEVSASWEIAAVTGLRVFHRPPVHEHSDHDHEHLADDYSDAGRLASGDSVKIPITLNMTDLGHDIQSRWAFFLCADNDGDPALAQGDAQVQITAHRMDGDLPLDAPHPNHWMYTDRLAIATLDWSGTAVSALNHAEEAWHQMRFHDHAIVPPSATRVEVNAWLNGTNTLDALQPVQLLLYYRDATESDWIFQSVAAQRGPDGGFRFEISVADKEMTDSAYAEATQWDLWLRIISETHTETPLGFGAWGLPVHFDGSLEARAYAVR